MKKLSIEDKAKRYEEVLAMAKEYVTYIPGDVANYIFNMFPELKESTDEGIRESIAGFLKTISSLKDGQTVSNEDFDTKVILEWVAWLKKQGKQSNEEPQVYETRDGEVITYSESKGYKVAEPKFKFGDWIILTAGELSVTLQIINVDINRERYWFNDGSYLPFADEECMHLWTINDAKAGDVLYYSDDTIVIFKYFHDDSSFCSYCYIDGGVFFTSNDRTPVWWMNNVFYPATKEQRELLFTKMKESGHEWDADKKELVEQMTGEEHKQYMLEHQDETIYDMSFEEAQDYLSKRGFDIPWNDGDVMVDERKLTQTVANVLKWADRHPLMLPYKKK